MGAGVKQVVWLLNTDFLVLVLISSLISWPVAYYCMDKCLQGFAYPMDFGLRPFVASTLMPFLTSPVITLVIALIITSLVSVKAARTNPAHRLKRE
jgi:putative ABC transport system permease protein